MASRLDQHRERLAASRPLVKMWKRLRLPNFMKRWGANHPFSPGRFQGARRWKMLAKEWPRIEAELCVWEDANPERYRELPWYEAREEFKKLKAEGKVVWPLWWELAGGINQLHGMTH